MSFKSKSSCYRPLSPDWMPLNVRMYSDCGPNNLSIAPVSYHLYTLPYLGTLNLKPSIYSEDNNLDTLIQFEDLNLESLTLSKWPVLNLTKCSFTRRFSYGKPISQFHFYALCSRDKLSNIRMYNLFVNFLGGNTR